MPLVARLRASSSVFATGTGTATATAMVTVLLVSGQGCRLGLRESAQGLGTDAGRMRDAFSTDGNEGGPADSGVDATAHRDADAAPGVDAWPDSGAEADAHGAADADASRADGGTELQPADPPTITANCAASIREDSRFRCPLTVETTSSRPTTWQVTPSHTCGWLPAPDSASELNAIPRNADVGPCAVSIQVNDGWTWSAALEFTLDVTNLRPTLAIADAAPLLRTTETVIVRSDSDVQASDEGSGEYTLDDDNASEPKCRDHGTLTLDTATGEISFLQSPTFQGRCNVLVVFDDLHPPENLVSEDFWIPVVGTDQAPVISPLACDLHAVQDQPFTCAVTGSDPDGDVLTWSRATGNRCSWLSVDPASGFLAGTPGDNDIDHYPDYGFCTLLLQASDGLLATVLTATIALQNITPTLTNLPGRVDTMNTSGEVVVLTDAEVAASEEGLGYYDLDRCPRPGNDNCNDWGDLNIDVRNGQVTFDPYPDALGTCKIGIYFTDRNRYDDLVLAEVEVSVGGSLPSGTVLSVGTGNLMTNGGCEDGFVRGDIDSWEEVEGTNWRCQPEIPPYECTAHFFAGVGAHAELSQWVDLSALTESIDDGAQVFEWRAFVQSWGASDASRTVVDYIAGDGSTVLSTFDSGEHIAPQLGFRIWEKIEDVRVVPIGTRWARVRLISTRYAGNDNDGYFDALRLRGLRVVE
ncbi:MAG: hypothetical protein H6729_05445 [Deltaproteobacteria bacterium]|nr:hypothetical protein [Deltaproteobacteria bacterium]